MAATDTAKHVEADTSETNVAFKLIYSVNGFIAEPAVVSAPTERRQKLTAGFGALRVNGPGEFNMYTVTRTALPEDIDEANTAIVRWWAAQQDKPEKRDQIAAARLVPEGAPFVNTLREEAAAAAADAAVDAAGPLPSFAELDIPPAVVLGRFFGQLGRGFDEFSGAAAVAAAQTVGLHPSYLQAVPLHDDATIDYTDPIFRAGCVDLLAAADQAVAGEDCNAEHIAALKGWDPSAAVNELQETLHGNVWNAWFAEDVDAMKVVAVLGLSDNGGANRFCTSVFVLYTQRRVYLLDLYAP